MAESDMLSPEDWDLWDRWMRAQRLLALEIDRRLQSAFGISKAEFSVLVTLLRPPGDAVRVVDLADLLGWEKSRVAHQLTRMESRGLVVRTESGASGRRTGIGLTPKGRRLGKAPSRRTPGTFATASSISSHSRRQQPSGPGASRCSRASSVKTTMPRLTRPARHQGISPEEAVPAPRVAAPVASLRPFRRAARRGSVRGRSSAPSAACRSGLRRWMS